MEKIVMFSTGCPRCRMLKEKLDEQEVEYEAEDQIDEIKKYDINSVPVLGFFNEDGSLLELKNFYESMEWLVKRKAGLID